jgi:hypothetical protein
MRKNTPVSDKPLFWMPPLTTKVESVLSEFRDLVSVIGEDRMRQGALGSNILEWYKHRYASSAVMIDAAPGVESDAVLFPYDVPVKKAGWPEELLFSPRRIYALRSVQNIQGRIDTLVVISLDVVEDSQLIALSRGIPDMGQMLALDLECLLWRIENNPRNDVTE